MRKALLLILAAGALFPAFAGNYALTNDLSVKIVDFFVRTSGSQVWGPDLLVTGQSILPDSTALFDLDNGQYDFRLVDEEGGIWLNVNVPVFGQTNSEIEGEYDLIDDDL